MKVKAITARKISDSRGIATVEVKVKSDKGVFTAASPSGTSSGRYEAVSIDVKKALYNVREVIAPKLLEKEFFSQKEVDEVLIGLAGSNKENMGANAVLPVSIACCRALAAEKKFPLYSYISLLVSDTNRVLLVSDTNRPADRPVFLPKPCVLLIEGAKHAKNKLDAQEFMVAPESAGFKEGLEKAKKIHGILKEKFGKKQGMEGGFDVDLENSEQALGLVKEVSSGEKLFIDVAASGFYENGKYNFEGKKRTAQEMLELYKKWSAEFNVGMIEDPFAEDDFDGWKNTKELQDRGVLIVGDDLTVTNLGRIQMAEEAGLCNAVIIKPNQIGTVTETIEAAIAAKESGWKRIVSHRSGDTTDDFIADLAVGMGAEFIKSGGPFAKERKAKYDRLLAIEKEI